MSKIVEDLSFQGIIPESFLHGYSSASYQVEGGYQQDGRGLSVWDANLRDAPTGNGNVACDSYNLWEEDVKLLQQYGATGYRFSISWSRIIPLGGKGDPVNMKGIMYYSNLIDGLLAAGITPFVTLFHWDMPLELEKRYGGWLARGDDRERLLADFDNYADVVFRAFGDRVQNWITHNEPQIFSLLHASVLKPKTFDMKVDRWILGNNLLLTHARAVDLYRRKYQQTQKGIIGITLNIEWVEPLDDSPEAKVAATKSLDIIVGWFADPIFLGKHNSTIKEIAGSALGDFTPEEWKIIYGSYDYFGLNHYSTRWATGKVLMNPSPDQSFFGGYQHVTEDRGGKPIGVRGHNGHPYTVPWGFRKLLNYIHDQWTGEKEIPIYITENGFAGADEAKKPLHEITSDVERQDYFEGYLKAMLLAIRDDKVVIKGYFGWSLLDNLEWSVGYDPRFGVTHVDRENGCKRTPKDSTKVVREIFDHVKAPIET